LLRGLELAASNKTGVVFNRSNLDVCCGVEKWLNFNLYFGYIGVPEHIEKSERDAKEADCEAQNMCVYVNNKNTFAL
jgi:hypothetical protein